MTKIIFLLSLLLINGCGKKDSYVYHVIPVEPEKEPPIQKYNERIKLDQALDLDRKIDVLWVVDNSGSMDSIQQNIIKNATLFMDTFKNNVFNWKMGVISTDKKDDFYLGMDPPFNPNTSNPVIEFTQAFKNLGTRGAASEYVFYNIHRMMTDNENNPPYSTFFRKNSHLAIIMVTDEKEQSKKKFGGIFEQISFLNTIKGLVSRNRVLRFYGALNFKDIQDCDGYDGTKYKGSPFEYVINKTGGIMMSACSRNFGTSLGDIGKDILSFISNPRILITETPVVSTIRVFFEGKELIGAPRHEGGDWYYDEFYKTINFYSADFGDDIETKEIEVRFDIEDGEQRD